MHCKSSVSKVIHATGSLKHMHEYVPIKKFVISVSDGSLTLFLRKAAALAIHWDIVGLVILVCSVISSHIYPHTHT